MTVRSAAGGSGAAALPSHSGITRHRFEMARGYDAELMKAIEVLKSEDRK